MNPINRDQISWPNRLATGAATFATRGIVRFGMPAYLIWQLRPDALISGSGTRLLTASIVILSAPSTLICALGAIEGTIRSLGHLAGYAAHRREEDANFRWDQFTKEMGTTQGLILGALSPVSGYTIIENELQKEIPAEPTAPNVSQTAPRVIKAEYLTYRAIRAFGRGVAETCRIAGRVINFLYTQLAWAAGKVWQGTVYAVTKTIDGITAVWNFIQPILKKIVVTAFDLTVRFVTEAWRISSPLRTVIAEVAKFAGRIIKKVIWDFAIKTIIWEALVKTVIADWLCDKFIWRFCAKIIIAQVIWPPVKWGIENVAWPILKNTALAVAWVAGQFLSMIAWTTQQALRLGR